MKWIPVSEKLPRINHNVLLSATNGEVFVGYRDKPDLIWQVTEVDGRKHWVYDPEAYTDDIDSLPRGEDCGFSRYTGNGYGADGMMSVTSLNYDERFGGVNAWMPLPKPHTADRNNSEIPNNSTISKMEQVEDETQTERHLPDYSVEAQIGRELMDCPWK